MRKLLYPIFLILLSNFVLADMGDMMGFGMMGTGMFSLFGLIYFAIGAFIFSVIFWLTHNWLAKKR
jgi:hypothetical protein